MRDAELGQLPVEPRDFFVPLLEGRLCPLECGTLLLESALGLFPRQALTLEGGPSLSEGGSLLLKLSARLLARILLPLEPLFRRGEGSGLVGQAGPQQLSLLSFLLGLALPGPRPLEGGAVLLKLSSGGSQLPLKFCCCNLHRGRILTRLPQRLVPLQEHRPHLRDCGDVFRSLGVPLLELILHSAQPVLQPPAVGSQGFDKSFQSVILVSIPVALRAQLIDAVIHLLGTALKLLSTMNETWEKKRSEECTGANVARENLEFDNESTYLEDLPRRTSVDPQGLVHRVVERGPMVSKFKPQVLLGLVLVKVGWRRAGGLPLLLQARHGGIWGGEAGA
jgi:hypothetical protein